MFTQLFRVADPYRELRQLDHLMSDFVRPRERPAASVAFDVLDAGDAYQVAADVPGLHADDLEIEATEDGLVIKGTRQVTNPEGFTAHRRERKAYRLARSFTFPTKIDPEQVEATLRDGVLTITLAKRADAKPRTIAVRTAA